MLSVTAKKRRLNLAPVTCPPAFRVQQISSSAKDGASVGRYPCLGLTVTTWISSASGSVPGIVEKLATFEPSIESKCC